MMVDGAHASHEPSVEENEGTPRSWTSQIVRKAQFPLLDPQGSGVQVPLFRQRPNSNNREEEKDTDQRLLR